MMMHRAYSMLETKSIMSEQRILYGIATSPQVDSMGDIVVPEGATFKLPLPFLWMHQADQPVGHVIDAKVKQDGIRVEIQIAKTDTLGPLKDRLDTAWESVKLGLVRGLSIGFRALEHEQIKGGYKFTKWQWFELSGVTIPANAACDILSVRSIDQAARAAVVAKPAKVYDHERAANFYRVGRPNSQRGVDGRLHSVKYY